MMESLDLAAIQRTSMLRMGERWNGLGKLKQASDTFLRIVQEYPGTAEAESAKVALVTMAGNFEAEGRYHLAIDIYDRLTEATV